MRAARAVDEVEVGVQRLAVAAEPDRQLALHLVEEERVVALVALRPPHLARPGSGGTNISGSTRVVITSAASTASAGSTPSAMRNTSESKRAPSWRARTWVTTPGEPHRFVAPGHRALADDDVVELEVLVGRERDPERQRGGVLGAEDPPDRLIAHASDGTAGVRQGTGHAHGRICPSEGPPAAAWSSPQLRRAA